MTTTTGRPTRVSGAPKSYRVSPRWVVTSLALFVIVWFLASLVSGSAILPGPLEVLQEFVRLMIQPFASLTLPGHVLASLVRWGTGLLIAIATGVPIGVAFGAIPTVRYALTPAFEFLRYIPPFAWIPLAILWMGAGQASAAFVVFVAAFPAIVINSQVGIATIDPRIKRAAVNLGAGSFMTIRQVLVPVALPGIFTGIRVAVSNGWMAVVAAELIGGTDGVGFLINQGQQNGGVTVVISGMIAIGITGAVIDGLVGLLGRRLTRWRRSHDATS